MAGVLNPRSISYSQVSALVKVFWVYFSFYRLFQPVSQVFWLFKGYSFWSMGVVLKRTEMFVFAVVGHYARSPRIRLANWISLGMMVTRFAWMAHRLVSSNSPTR